MVDEIIGGSGSKRLVSPAHVAIVDDNPDTCESLALFLRVSGFEATAFSSGPSFLDAIESSEPAAVVLDLAMPVMDGVTVLRTLREARGSAMPVIILSAHVDAAAARDVRRLGVTAILSKPVAAEALLSAVEDALSS
jgi:FixJ family two-component response regulator